MATTADPGDAAAGGQGLLLDDLVIALHDFVPPPTSANTCLSFRAGQLIRVLNRDPSGWWDGETVIKAVDGSVVPWTDPDAPDAAAAKWEAEGGALSSTLGRRGWLPSNFTAPVGANGAPAAVDMDRRPSAASSIVSSDGSAHSDGGAVKSGPQASRPASPNRSLTVDVVPASQTSDRTPRPDSPSRLASSPDVLQHTAARAAPSAATQPILDAVTTALAHLSSAASDRRVSQIQPATAYVISSVRAVLDAARCLTRESDVLGRHPSLARERRHILSVLSILVEKARRASAGSSDGPTTAAAGGGKNGADMEEMLFTADRVYAHVRKFLTIAEQAGIELPNPLSGPGSSGTEQAVDTAVRAISARSGRLERSRGLRLAQSSNDVRRAARRKGSDASSLASSSGGGGPRSAPLVTTAEEHRQRWGLDDDDAEEEVLSTSGSSHEEEANWRPSHSVSSSVSSVASSLGPATPGIAPATVIAGGGEIKPDPRYKVQTTTEILADLSTIHDRLLSTVAAFVGHVSAHSRASHPASYARLIDMTREAIDTVREVLVVVEAVSNHGGTARTRRREVAGLAEAKEGLYVATTALVTAARVATSPPANEGPDAEDEEKDRLLTSATGVLRMGNDCITAVGLCVKRLDGGSDTFKVAVQDLAAAAEGTSTKQVVESAELALEQDEDQTQTTITAWSQGAPGTSRRERHTLSMLGRKATSLGVIRNAFEGVDGSALSNSLARFEEQDEEEEGGGDGWVEGREEDAGAGGQGMHARVGSSGTNSMSGTSTATSVPSSNGRTAHPFQQRHPYARSSTDPSPARSASPAGEPMRRDVSSHASAASSIAPSLARMSSSQASTAASSPPPSLGGSPNDCVAHPLRDAKEEEDWLALSCRQSQEPAGAAAMGRSVSESAAKHLQARTKFPTTQDWLHRRDYPPQEMSFNSSGSVTGGTLRSLVERMTLHDTPIEAAFANAFFLTFRMFADPVALADALADRFRLSFPADVEPTPEQVKAWTEQKIVPVRLRVYNFLKTWLELHWRPETDSVALLSLLDFAQRDVASVMPAPSQRLLDLIAKRGASGNGALAQSVGRQSSDKTRAGRADVNSAAAAFAANAQALPPTPVIAKSILQHLRAGPTSMANVSVSDLDPLELARQITVMESKLFCAIRPEELLGQQFSKKAGIATNVRAMTALSTKITGWIAETILNEQDARKRTHLVKYFLKLGDRCHTLQNYNALMAVMTALNSSTISRLKKTWDGLNNKYRTIHETLNRAVNHGRNYAEYRATLRHAQPPCLPFLGVYLTDITFCHEGNPTHRSSPLDPSLRLINFDRYQKMSKIIGDLQRFQIPFNVQEVPEIQLYIVQSLESLQHGGSPDSLYRRSLLVEPREPSSGAADIPSYQPDGGRLFNWKGEVGRAVGITA